MLVVELQELYIIKAGFWQKDERNLLLRICTNESGFQKKQQEIEYEQRRQAQRSRANDMIKGIEIQMNLKKFKSKKSNIQNHKNNQDLKLIQAKHQKIEQQKC